MMTEHRYVRYSQLHHNQRQIYGSPLVCTHHWHVLHVEIQWAIRVLKILTITPTHLLLQSVREFERYKSNTFDIHKMYHRRPVNDPSQKQSALYSQILPSQAFDCPLTKTKCLFTNYRRRLGIDPSQKQSPLYLQNLPSQACDWPLTKQFAYS